jgi:hypothetical protein
MSSRPKTPTDADVRSRLRDVERRICDQTAVTIGAMPFAKVGKVQDLKSLCAERDELQKQLVMVE